MAASFYAALSSSARQAFTDAGVPREFVPESVIFAQGSPAHSVAIVLDGHAKIVRHAAAGRDTLLAIRSSGRLLGVEELDDLGERLRRRSATLALTRVRALVIEKGRFFQVLHDRGSGMSALLTEMRNNVLEYQARATSMNTDSVKQRLAKALLALLPREPGQAVPGPGRIVHNLTQADLAQLIGAARETVERTLGEWRTANILITDYRSVVVLSPGRLLRLIGLDEDGHPLHHLTPLARNPRTSGPEV
ncbi:Crp/Fnr family transcriptional regulator [Actinomadura sp. K4S16]|uniref:Crp/Fnr family transcriptional regulator n=1 Tax=Actinomadura sp. K4S16 TaxID=1316147 RepID=UPI0013581A85|nr:Crp/Fnr family transcriptional regulator [Actinomadura sp. K4S16]